MSTIQDQIASQMANGAHGAQPSTASETAAPGYEANGVVAPAEKSVPLGGAPAAVGEPSAAAATVAPGIDEKATAPAPGAEAPAAAAAAPAPVAATNGDAAAPATTDKALAPLDTAANVAAPNGETTASPAPVTAGGASTTAAATPVAAVLNPKEVKKYDKLLATEAKGEEKSLKIAIKDAAAAEKTARKSRDAEAQSVKRHAKAVKAEHVAAKKLSQITTEHDKRVAELEKANEDLEIKKRHTQTTQEGYETAKAYIEKLRATKVANDADRARRASSMHGTAPSATA